MKVRRYLESDYETIKTWWERRGTEAPREVLLPQTGVIAEKDGMAVACAFLYEDKKGTVGMVEWEATNPDVHSAMTHIRGLNLVFDFFEKYCAEKGISVVLSWVEEGRGDGRLLERRKWIKCPGSRHELMAFSTQPQEALCPQ